MAILNTIAQWLAADGVPLVYASNINLNANVPVYMPGPAKANVFALKPRAGYVRIKQNSLGNVNTNVKIAPIQATDGTNVANLYAGDVNYSTNGNYIDSTFFFWYDWPVANINIGNIQTQQPAGTPTFDVECVGLQ